MDNQLLSGIENMARDIRRDIVEMSFRCGGNSHIGGGLSMADILAVLYGGVLKYRPSEPEWPERDRFILSKGHGVLGYYAALHRAGFISDEQMNTFQINETDLSAHPVRNMSIGIESSNGSLGQGLSYCVGLALVAKMRGQNHRVITLLGNGECNEGSVWEAVMSAKQYKLDNLLAIVDDNGLQSDGESSAIMDMSPIEEKFAAFGWSVRVVNGHDTGAVYESLADPASKGKPTAVIAKTVKGKGFTFSEGKPEWHHARLTESLYTQALSELEVR